MKKGWILICALLAMLTALPALAQSTGINVDGKTYVITGGDGTYELDGKTFVIEGDTVVVHREGMEDLYLHLESAQENVKVVGDAVGSVTVYVDDGIVEDTAAGNAAVYTFNEEEGTTQVEVIAPGTGAVTDMVCYSIGEKRGAAVEYSAYAKYGLSYDATHDLLYYNGTLVRIMEDDLWLDGNSAAALAFYNSEGEVDVRALRDAAGELIGLEALSEEEFAARDQSVWLESESVTYMEMTATDGEELPREEREAFFAPYADFGLRYDAENDLLFYQDKQVRRFVDIRVSNGEALEGGRFSGEMTQLVYAGGEVDVTTVRDYEQPDAEGEGKLIGLTVEEAK